jgi:Ca2+-binding RTX toxin-like protein
MTDHSPVVTSENLRLWSGQDRVLSGPVTLRGTSGDDVLVAGDPEEGNFVLIGGGGRDQLYAGDGHGPTTMNQTTFVITKASDLVAGEVYQGDPDGDHFETYFTSMVGNSIKADVSLAGITLTDVQQISGFAGTLTMTAGQLGAFDAVHAGAVRLADGGTVHLARFSDVRDVYLADRDTALAFTAADIYHLTGYGTTMTYHTGIAAGLAVHGGTGNDTITAQAAGDVFNTRIAQLGVSLFGGGGDDSLTGAQRNDILNGGLGDDLVFGGRGRDILIASEGDDTLTGGARADQFRIGFQPGGSDDTIADFSGLGTVAAGDRIRIADGVTQAVYLGAEVFSASGVTEVRYAHGMLKIDFDGNGTADSSFFLTGMTLATQLTQDDFM